MSDRIELPNVDDMFNLADKITELSKKKSYLELEIKFEESDTVRKATIDSEYFVNGKPPSMAYINSTYLFTGIDGSLYKKRKELVDLSSDLEGYKIKLYLYKDILDLYRTQSANERVSVM